MVIDAICGWSWTAKGTSLHFIDIPQCNGALFAISNNLMRSQEFRMKEKFMLARLFRKEDKLKPATPNAKHSGDIGKHGRDVMAANMGVFFKSKIFPQTPKYQKIIEDWEALCKIGPPSIEPRGVPLPQINRTAMATLPSDVGPRLSRATMSKPLDIRTHYDFVLIPRQKLVLPVTTKTQPWVLCAIESTKDGMHIVKVFRAKKYDGAQSATRHLQPVKTTDVILKVEDDQIKQNFNKNTISFTFESKLIKLLLLPHNAESGAHNSEHYTKKKSKQTNAWERKKRRVDQPNQ